MVGKPPPLLAADTAFRITVGFKGKKTSLEKTTLQYTFKHSKEDQNIYFEDDRNVFLKKVLKATGLENAYQVAIDAPARPAHSEDEGSDDDDEEPAQEIWLSFAYGQDKEKSTPQPSGLKTVKTVEQYWTFRQDIASYTSSANGLVKGGIYVLLQEDKLEAFSVKSKKKRKARDGGIDEDDILEHGQKWKPGELNDRARETEEVHKELEKKGLTLKDEDGTERRMDWRVTRLWATRVVNGTATREVLPADLPFQNSDLPDRSNPKRKKTNSSLEGLLNEATLSKVASAIGKGIGEGMKSGGARGQGENSEGRQALVDFQVDDEDGTKDFYQFAEYKIPGLSPEAISDLQDADIGPFALADYNRESICDKLAESRCKLSEGQATAFLGLARVWREQKASGSL